MCFILYIYYEKALSNWVTVFFRLYIVINLYNFHLIHSFIWFCILLINKELQYHHKQKFYFNTSLIDS